MIDVVALPAVSIPRAPARPTKMQLWLATSARTLLAGCLCLFVGLASAQGAESHAGAQAHGTEPTRTVAEWLARLREASKTPSYQGTYVVTSASGAMSSARIWHRAEDNEELESVEALSGPPRTIFRKNNEVLLFLPKMHVVRMERHSLGQTFPNLVHADGGSLAAEYYTVRNLGEDRVAGLETDVVLFKPRDNLRYAYRVWSEKQTGLMLKSQILDASGRVLEQAAFSEIDLNPPADVVQAHLVMPSMDGMKQEKVTRERVDPASEGWSLKGTVAGFEPQGFYKKSVAGSRSIVQWVFSDGLSTVSLFMEPYDAERHMHPGTSEFGATHALRRRWPDVQGNWWVTSVGEVPPRTLERLVENLQRTAG